MKINSTEPIEWKIFEPLPGEFPCFCCQGVNGNATHFVNAELEGEHRHDLKLPVCEKCAEYARVYPTWLEEMLLRRRLEAASDLMKPESVPAAAFGF